MTVENDEVVLRIPRLNNVLRRFLPEDTVQHLYAAQREQLLAMRSMIDHAIERVETAQREPPTPRRTEIRVE